MLHDTAVGCARLACVRDLRPQCLHPFVCIHIIKGLAVNGEHYAHTRYLRVALVRVATRWPHPISCMWTRHVFQLVLATVSMRQEDAPPCLRQTRVHVQVLLRCAALLCSSIDVLAMVVDSMTMALNALRCSFPKTEGWFRKTSAVCASSVSIFGFRIMHATCVNCSSTSECVLDSSCSIA